MKNINISIITISFNNKSDIEDTIKSVINQSYGYIEYIIIDGGSTDGTIEIIDKYKTEISKFISGKDKNLYDAINKGIKIATGDVIGLIHAGDRIFDCNVISKVANHFTKYQLDALYGHSYITDQNDIPVRINKSPEFRKSLFRIGWMPSHQSVYIKKDKIDQLGLYRLDLHPSSDYEFILRYFYFNDLKVRLLDAFIVKFALGGRSTKNYWNNLRAQKQHIECWKVNNENPPIYLVPLKLLRKVKQFSRAYYLKLKR